ncbi:MULTISPECIES: hypothetical protein [Halorubrum]|uniref:hypothetical protein n=1 Tax=Halorubrum TaxID=56688 RepID=UPI00135F14F7|nr:MULTISPECIES: hypothetical protein [Halorubrum]
MTVRSAPTMIDDERAFAAVMIALSVLIFLLVFRSERSESALSRLRGPSLRRRS